MLLVVVFDKGPADKFFVSRCVYIGVERLFLVDLDDEMRFEVEYILMFLEAVFKEREIYYRSIIKQAFFIIHLFLHYDLVDSRLYQLQEQHFPLLTLQQFLRPTFLGQNHLRVYVQLILQKRYRLALQPSE